MHSYKRTIILCFILFILVLLVLNRWDIWWEGSMASSQHDRLTSFVFYKQVGRIWAKYHGYGLPESAHLISNAVTIILNSAIVITIVALLRESKK
jgi:hypothetical protein